MYMTSDLNTGYVLTGLILSLQPDKERRRYKVTPSLIGWAETKNQSHWCCCVEAVAIYLWPIMQINTAALRIRDAVRIT